MKRIILVAASLAAGQALAATELKDCVIQEVLPGKNMTGAFLTIVHEGGVLDIASGEIPSVTEHVEFHQMVMKDNIMEMSPLENRKVEAGERQFKKGGDHLMLMQIPEDKQPKKGDSHTITLRFSDGSAASCAAEVKTVEELIEAAQMAGDHGHDHGHGSSHKH
ncbi:MAG: copper chaperone PCu(A)C [Cardiobacteriaceae bacterium]|nr:copper chaperone PCu(A)C [Cardiobacteriaceae bacterium]